jgi:hypothetical protein
VVSIFYIAKLINTQFSRKKPFFPLARFLQLISRGRTAGTDKALPPHRQTPDLLHGKHHHKEVHS